MEQDPEFWIEDPEDRGLTAAEFFWEQELRQLLGSILTEYGVELTTDVVVQRDGGVDRFGVVAFLSFVDEGLDLVGVIRSHPHEWRIWEADVTDPPFTIPPIAREDVVPTVVRILTQYF